MAGCAGGGWLIALFAATPIPAPAPAPAQAPAAAPVAVAVPAPSMDLLLHLAEFGDAQDRYVDPAELDDAATQAELERADDARQERTAEERDDDAP